MQVALLEIYDPPVKSARPFGADYPLGAKSDETGKLLADIEGRPLIAEHLVGRRLVGGADEALPPAQYGSVTAGSIGALPEGVASRALPRGTVGVYREVRGVNGPERSILFDRSLPEHRAQRVVAHEMGHMVDELNSQIPTQGLNTELRSVYNTPNTGQERTRHVTGPQHAGYRGASVDRELMAEAVRAYVADPNYLKTVAPKTAARIRAFVNSNLRLKNIVQFNSLIGAALIGGEMAGETQAQGSDNTL